MHLSTIALAAGYLPALALSAATPSSPRLFTRRDVSIAEAPSANLLPLSPHPNPDIYNSPVRSRIAALKGQQPTHKRTGGSGTGSQTINTIWSGVYPVLNVTWGSKSGKPQQFLSFIDTGSADTWAVSKSMKCVDIDTGASRSQAACAFGTPLYDTARGSFSKIADQTFSISYFPEGEKLRGSMGKSPITIGGVTVPDQQVALVDYAAWEGDGYTNGLLGLAYPPVTSARSSKTGRGVEYDPLFTSMVKKGLVSDAVFTLAVNRVPQGTSPSADAGLMAVGGLVPDSYYDAPFTSVPTEATAGSGSELSWYATTHEFVYQLKSGARRSAGKYQSIVDSGTAPNFVPTAAAKELNAQFEPPAVYNKTLGYWTVDCDAKAPYAAFVIGGVEMPMDPQDMVVHDLNGLPGYEHVCFSAFADGGSVEDDNMIIGAVWQRNYVVAYDQGRSMMHFAKRKAY